MIIKIQGLNGQKMRCERFEINIDDNTCTSSLENLYFTFDSVYLIKPDQKPFIFDSNTNLFEPLETIANYRFLSFSSNTNYFWALALHLTESTFLLIQYSNRHLVKQREVALSGQFSVLDDLLILSTDVNLYLFENGSKGLKCLYQLKKKADLDESQVTKEVFQFSIVIKP